MMTIDGNRLPVEQYREAIVTALKDQQVVITAGETGSGKSVLIPQYCREALAGSSGKIAVTEPRRIAAISLAGYAARRNGTTPGEEIGYVVRYRRSIRPQTRICYMTDGILLAELLRNPVLSGYAAVMIDEAHERSTTIDYLLGYMRVLLKRRPEFRLIIASATLNTRLFFRFFNGPPVITIGQRRHHVDIQYHPVMQLWKGVGIDSFIEGVIVAVERICVSGERGDILAFLPTVDDVEETVRRLRHRVREAGIIILPLHGRLDGREQERIFSGHGGRKVVIATNIAETSVTVPGIRFVIDSGLVRMLRYAPEASLSRMPVEKISQASAMQRAGRCGRTADGICIRLYSEQDFASRPGYTLPEIRRSSLAGVLLRLHLQRIIAPAAFPFPESPSRQLVDEGYRQLRELGAVDHRRSLTRFGRAMARFPLDPPVACMLLRAREYGVVQEVMVIAAALSATDPLAATEGADTRRLRTLRHRESDFMTFLSAWTELHRNVPSDRGGMYRSVKKFTDEYSLHQTRVQEWIDAYHHIRRIYEELYGALLPPAEQPSYDAIHKSLLSGLVAGVATAGDDGLYNGVNNDAIAVASVSAVAKRRIPWLLFHELVETDRIYGIRAARIEPKWIEELFGWQCTYRHEDPWYDGGSGEVMVREEVSYRHLVLIRNRAKLCRFVNRELACTVFVREALVAGAEEDTYRFLHDNAAVIKAIKVAQCKLRRTLYAGDDVLEALYAERLGDVASRGELNRFLGENDGGKHLRIGRDDLLAVALPQDIDDYTDEVAVLGFRMPVAWKWAEGEIDDGAVITVPEAVASVLPAWYWAWAVPALAKLRFELLVLRLAPELIAKGIDPADAVDAAQAALLPCGPWENICREFIGKTFGVAPTSECYRGFSPPDWMQPAVRVHGADGSVVAFFRTPQQLKRGERCGYRASVSGLPGIPDAVAVDPLRYEGGPPLLQPLRSDGGPVAPVVWYGFSAEKHAIFLKAFTDGGTAETFHCAALIRLCEERCAEPLTWEIEAIRISDAVAQGIERMTGSTECSVLAERIMMKRVLRMTGDLPVTAGEIRRFIADCQQRIPGAAAAVAELLGAVSRAFGEARRLLERKSERVKDAVGIRMMEWFAADLQRYAGAVTDAAAPYDYLARMPQRLEHFALRVDSALLDPSGWRTIAVIADSCNGVAGSCGRVTRRPVVVAREVLQNDVEEMIGAWIRKEPQQERLRDAVERKRELLEKLLDDYMRL